MPRLVVNLTNAVVQQAAYVTDYPYFSMSWRWRLLDTLAGLIAGDPVRTGLACQSVKQLAGRVCGQERRLCRR